MATAEQKRKCIFKACVGSQSAYNDLGFNMNDIQRAESRRVYSSLNNDCMC